MTNRDGLTLEQFLQLFPNSTPATLRANGFESARPVAVAERTVRYEPVAAPSVKEKDSGRFFVRLTSVRNQLLDEDNLCPKFHVDLLRYAGIIPSDAPDRTGIRTTQRKCREGEEEHVEIAIDLIEG